MVAAVRVHKNGGPEVLTFEEVEVGGDFYDFVETQSGWLVLLGDVTGRGVEAASITSLVRHGARFLAKREHSPSRILAELDVRLHDGVTGINIIAVFS